MPADDKNLKALRRFAVAITALNILGHTVLGFEQSHLQSVVAVLAAYLTEMTLEGVSAWSDRRRPRFLTGRWQNRIDFFLPPHISGLAVGMLTYANDRLWVVVFGA